MRFDDRSSDVMTDDNKPGMESGGEPALLNIEILQALLDAAKTQRYIDWAAFTLKDE